MNFQQVELSTELIVELHFGIGGEDAKQFVEELFSAYLIYARRCGLQAEVVATAENGHAAAKIVGAHVWKLFQHEAGGHCVQRYPDNDRGGRRHTSMVSVAVLPLPPERTFTPLPDSELEVITQCGKRGPGGQNKNKVASAVRMRHLPTGLHVFIDGRDQRQNKKLALRVLTARVNQHRHDVEKSQYLSLRKDQLGGGGRGSKLRTYNFIRSEVVDHRSGKRAPSNRIMDGEIDLLA